MGALVFLGGVALLVFTFKLASEMFLTDPATYFKSPAKTPIDVNVLQGSILGLVFRLILLLVMAIIGGMIANRGIRMYSDSRGSREPAKMKSAD